MDLEYHGLSWLRYEQQCPLAWEQRNFSLGSRWTRPDLCGITKDRKAIEIEIKRTLADFKADSDKPKIELLKQAGRGEYLPWKFFYLAEKKLAVQMVPLLTHDIFGVLSLDPKYCTVDVLKPSVPYRKTYKIKLKHMVQIAMNISAYNLSLRHTISGLRNRLEVLSSKTDENRT